MAFALTRMTRPVSVAAEEGALVHLPGATLGLLVKRLSKCHGVLILFYRARRGATTPRLISGGHEAGLQHIFSMRAYVSTT